MAGVNTSFDVALMHAVLYVKLHFEIGSAFESTVHAVAAGGLGKVSSLFQEVLDDLHRGEDYKIALDRVGNKTNHEGFKALTSALSSSPAQASKRLEDVAEMLLARQVSEVEAYQKRVDMVIRLGTISFLGSFGLLFLKLAGSIETNSVLPTMAVPEGTIQLGYLALSAVIVICLLLMMPRRSG